MTAKKVTSDPQSSVAAVEQAANSQPATLRMPRAGKLREFGIHGARGAGKTCYLACLYGQRATEQTAITFSDDHSIDHLRTAWKLLERGEVPDATALTLPTELHMSLSANGLAWNITNTGDYVVLWSSVRRTGVP